VNRRVRWPLSKDDLTVLSAAYSNESIFTAGGESRGNRRPSSFVRFILYHGGPGDARMRPSIANRISVPGMWSMQIPTGRHFGPNAL
jgi:hypothetical protein